MLQATEIRESHTVNDRDIPGPSVACQAAPKVVGPCAELRALALIVPQQTWVFPGRPGVIDVTRRQWSRSYQVPGPEPYDGTITGGNFAWDRRRG